MSDHQQGQRGQREQRSGPVRREYKQQRDTVPWHGIVGHWKVVEPKPNRSR